MTERGYALWPEIVVLKTWTSRGERVTAEKTSTGYLLFMNILFGPNELLFAMPGDTTTGHRITCRTHHS